MLTITSPSVTEYGFGILQSLVLLVSSYIHNAWAIFAGNHKILHASYDTLYLEWIL